MGSCITGWRVNTSLKQPVEGPRVGLFGLLGTGNIGNDASMEAVLRYVQTQHPSAVIDVMCSGPERVTEQYGIDAVPYVLVRPPQGPSLRPAGQRPEEY